MKKGNNFLFNIHPYLIALFCVFSLYSHNKDLVNLSYALWPTVLTLSLTLFVHLTLLVTLKHGNKAAFLTSFFVFSFLSFGRLTSFLEIFLNEKVVYSTTLLTWVLVIFFLFLKTKKSKKEFSKTNFYLNLFSVTLLLVTLVNIAHYEFKAKSTAELIEIANEEGNLKEGSKKPDIYYIVLDGFARQDVLREVYNADNSNFVSSLEDLGFFVANQSTANYPQTYLSISSTLNMQYLDDLVLTMGKESTDRGPLRKLIKDNQVHNLLKENGYKFVSFPQTWTGTTNNQHTDIYMQNQIGLGEFGDLVVDLTPLSIFARKNIQQQQHRNKILNVFENMSHVAKIKEPTFTYTHILAPHPPFIFKKDGGLTNIEGKMYGNDGDHYFEMHPDKEEYRQMYVDQLTFISKKALEMVGGILANSKEKPIIVLQSDHGPGLGLVWDDEEKTDLNERFGILNAYLLPTDEETKLYEDITPVNSFRVIFNNTFKTNYKLLPDKNYFVRWNSPYNHIDVTNKIQ